MSLPVKEGALDATIVAGVDKFQGIDNDYPVFDTIADVNVDFDVVIDFSNASAVDSLVDYCEKNNKPVVLCTTGLSGEMLAHVDAACKNVAIL